MSIPRPLAGVVALTLLVAACSSSGTPAPAAASPSASASAAASASPSASASASPSASPTLKPTPTAAPTPTPQPTPVAFSLSSQVWYSGYAITVTGGTYDPLKHKLNIDISLQNQSTQQTEASQLSNGVKVVWNGQFLPGYVTSGPVPVGATAQAQIQLQPPADFAVDTAVVAFGQPSEHQALVPLNGDAATSDQPTTLAIAGTIKMGKFVTFKVTKSMLVPASCTGYPDRIRFGALPKNQISIVLWGTATNSEASNYAQIDQGFVTIPDGTTAISNPAVGMSLPGKATLRDQGMCFAVPAPATGAYKLTMHEYRSKANGTMPFTLP
jgi:hypothetical protein